MSLSSAVIWRRQAAQDGGHRHGAGGGAQVGVNTVMVACGRTGCWNGGCEAGLRDVFPGARRWPVLDARCGCGSVRACARRAAGRGSRRGRRQLGGPGLGSMCPSSPGRYSSPWDGKVIRARPAAATRPETRSIRPPERAKRRAPEQCKAIMLPRPSGLNGHIRGLRHLQAAIRTVTSCRRLPQRRVGLSSRGAGLPGICSSGRVTVTAHALRSSSYSPSVFQDRLVNALEEHRCYGPEEFWHVFGMRPQKAICPGRGPDAERVSVMAMAFCPRGLRSPGTLCGPLCCQMLQSA
jgi:hypothetical protein